MKGLMIFSDGMEDNEALSTLALLRRSKFSIDTVTYNKSLDVVTSYQVHVKADYLIDQVDYNDYDFLIIPGGGYVARVIENDTVIRNAVRTFASANKVIAAICYAPAFLGIEGVLDNLTYTSYPGSEKYCQKGKQLSDKKVVVDGKIVTARSAGAVVEFVYQIINTISNKATADALLNEILYY